MDAWPARSASAPTRSAGATTSRRRVPLQRRRRPGVRQRRLRRRPRRRPRAGRLRRASAPSRQRGGTTATRCSSASASPPTSRCAAWPRPGAGLAQLRRRRLGVGHRAAAAHRQGAGRHRRRPHGQGHETTWSMIVADKLGIDPDDVEVLHSDTAISPRPRHLRQPLARGRRHAVTWPPRRCSTRPGHRRPPAGGARGRPRVRRRRVPGQGHARQGDGHRASPSAGLHRPRPARRHGAEPHGQVTYDPPNFAFPFGTHVAVVEVDTETGTVELRRLHRRRRLRQPGQPADRRGPGPRRRRPGRRPGAVGGGRVRRRRQPRNPTLIDYPMPVGAEAAELHARPHGHAEPDQPARGEGHRRGRHHRLGAGRDQRHRRRPVAVRHHRHRHARHTRTGVGRDPRAKAAVVIPAAFDYVRAGSADEAPSPARRARRRRQALAGGHSLLPLMKLRLAGPAVLIDIGRLRPVLRPRGRRPRRHRRPDPPPRPRDHRRPREQVPLLAHVAGQVGDPQVRHRGTIGGSIAHGDPASDLPGRAARPAGRARGRGPGRRAHDRRRRLLHRVPRDGAGARRGAHRDPRARGPARGGRSRSSTGGPRTGRSSASPPCTTAPPASRW